MAALSPVKIENTTSIECLKLEYSLVQNALKAGHKDSSTVQRGHKVRWCMVAFKTLIIMQFKIEGPRTRVGQPKMNYWKLQELHKNEVKKCASHMSICPKL